MRTQFCLLLMLLLSLPALAGPIYYKGGITRGHTKNRAVSFVFTGGYHGEGAEYILDVLKEKKVRGSFFLTGNYLRNSSHKAGILRMVKEGHYVGAHSDNHPKYVKSFSSTGTLISQRAFVADLDKNFAELAKFGIKKSDAPFFIPPYEAYNQTIVKWAKEYGLTLFNYTPGTRTNGDYTDPSMSHYYSSAQIMSFIRAEALRENGLNGHLMLIHLGVGPKRTDKFYHQLGPLIEELRAKNYQIVSVPELLSGK
ncbi:MAG: polysaccharide deacetylase family protein [Verrucomicrobiales bacterium]|nr:polysaccharide deacetylase family protein [Verrucomicrobiales bacterium]